MNKAKFILELLNKKLGIDITSKRRSNDYVFARAIYFKLAGMYTGLTLARQAEVVNRDHSTAIHSNNNVIDYVLTMPIYKKIFIECCEILDPMGELPEDAIVTENNKRIAETISNLVEAVNIKEKKILELQLEPHEIKYRQLSGKDQMIFKQRAEAILNMMMA